MASTPTSCDSTMMLPRRSPRTASSAVSSSGGGWTMSATRPRTPAGFQLGAARAVSSPGRALAHPLHDGPHAALEALVAILNLGERLQARAASVRFLAQGFELDLAPPDLAAQGRHLALGSRLALGQLGRPALQHRQPLRRLRRLGVHPRDGLMRGRVVVLELPRPVREVPGSHAGRFDIGLQPSHPRTGSIGVGDRILPGAPGSVQLVARAGVGRLHGRERARPILGLRVQDRHLAFDLGQRLRVARGPPAVFLALLLGVLGAPHQAFRPRPAGARDRCADSWALFLRANSSSLVRESSPISSASVSRSASTPASSAASAVVAPACSAARSRGPPRGTSARR